MSGVDPDEPLRAMVYVGESESVGTRLRQHDKDQAKEFYDRAIVLISKDENLTKAHARYLEGRLVSRIRSAERTRSLNSNDPGLSPLPEADRSDMEFFISQVELVLPVLGLDILRLQAHINKMSTNSTLSNSEGEKDISPSPTFIFNYAGTEAEAQEIGNEFVVKAGSLARQRENPTIPNAAKLIRKQLLDDGTLVPDRGDMLRFTKDVAFRSPSGAGGVVYGGSVNGREYWKDKISGFNYAEWREQSLERSTIGKGANSDVRIQDKSIL